jgi:alkaline phosphatase D
MRIRSFAPSSPCADAPSFAAAGGFTPLADPFRAAINIRSAGPGNAQLATRIVVELGACPTVPVHWEIARDPSFRRPERYGLLLARDEDAFAVQVMLQGLERGRTYWARLWAGGAWSRPVRVRTGRRANGSSALSLTLARRLQSKAG